MTLAEPARPRRRAVLVGVLLATSSVALALLTSEAVLRLTGFQFHLMPSVQFGWPDPQTIKANYTDDPDLFWVTKDYHQKLGEARRSHPEIVFMGDSCTEFGRYPQRTLETLAESTGRQPSGIHLAAGGWTSEQGLTQLGRDVIGLRPHVIVVYYGWNDHWIALGPTDSRLSRAHRWLWLSEHSRLVQLALKAWIGASVRGTERPVRVSPDEYLDNLRRISRLAREHGIVPVLVTAPSNHVPGHEPEYLLRRHVNRLSDVVPLHQRYIELTRTAARNTDAVLCDAADAFTRLPDRVRLFRADGIHFTDEGDIALGRIVGACVATALGRHT